ncbi:MAG: efflux RND transporter permease subunit [Methanoregulaceae archaeon]|nr:efflux RND transporter permease subunit [Methanoregulaceae archaeon]
MNLTRVAIARPVFMLMLMLAAVFIGRLSYQSMRVEQNPDVQFGVITVTTIYPGAGPDEINTLISRKVEEAMAGVPGIREVTSTSQEGISSVVGNFEVGTNMDTALNDARAKVDSIVGQLPQGIEKPTVGKLDSSSEPVVYMVARNDNLSNRELRDLVDDRIKDRIAQIPGVASVNVSGGEVREIQVRLRKDALVSYGVGIAQVMRAVQGASLNVPSGRVIQGDTEYSVRVLGEYTSIEEIGETVLSISDPDNPMAKGKLVKLNQIADIVDTSRERTQYSRLNGSDAVVMIVQKAREGNAVEIAKRMFGSVEAPIVTAESVAAKKESGQTLSLIEQILDQYGVQLVVTTNQAVIIQESVSDLNFTLIFGIFLVSAIVYIFLHNLRGTIIVSIAIPVCIFATFIAMKMLGFTINNLSMLALSLAIGVLVDDAIVVLENIYRHLRMGEDPRDAALNGRAEIGLAAIAITLADVVVFLPIGFMGGILGQFFRPLGIGFAIAVLVSLFVSFTITPMLAARWYRAGEDMEHFERGFAGWFERRFDAFTGAYRRTLAWALDHRWFVFITGNLALVAIIMVIVGTFAGAGEAGVGAAVQAGIPLVAVSLAIGFIVFVVNLFRGYRKPQFILYGLLFGLIFPASAGLGGAWAQWKQEAVFKFAFFPPSDNGRVNVDIELPPGSSLAATQRVVEYVEGIVTKHPDTKSVLANVGTVGAGGFGGTTSGSNRASVIVALRDKKAFLPWQNHGVMRTKKDTDIAAELTEQLGRVAGARVTVSSAGGVGFGAPIQMSFGGDNREVLVRTVDAIRRGLENGAIEGVINPDISSKPGKPELRALPDRTRLADANLTVADVANTMRILYEGNDDTKYRVAGREYDIRVMMDYVDRDNPDIVGKLPVSFYQGNPIFLSEVAEIVPGIGVDKLDRRDRADEVRLTADLLPGYSAGNVQNQIDDWLEKENLVPEGVKIKPLGQADVQAREGGYLFGALGIGLLLVYMLLASLYDNLLYPFIIQLAQPQAMVGALLALMISDKTLNIVGFIGIITLVGLVGKNAILLVDYTNTLRARGKSRREAILEAGPTRLRPIMMTTLALILGVLPVALAIGRGSEFRETIGITIIGGISLSTILTLVVIPCSYTIFDDVSRSFSRRRGIKLEDEV